MMVIARFLAALFAAWVVGWSWTLLDPHRRLARARSAPVGEIRTRPAAEVPRPARRAVFAASASHDFVHAGGFLVLGAAIAAAVKVLVPSEHLTRLGGQVLTGLLTMAALAVLVCVCSEADAFVAASFTAFSSTAQLVFMTVSPMIDLKLVAMQAGTFGLGLVLRFVSLTLLACVGLGSLVGMVAL